LTEKAKKVSAALKLAHKPYPFSTNMRHQLVVSLSFGLFIYLFLRFFQPFGLMNLGEDKSLIIFGFAAITSLIMIFSNTIMPLMLTSLFDPDQWTIGKNILFSLWNILIIALLNYLYNQYVRGDKFHLEGLLSFVIITISVGIFPVTSLAFINELYLRGKHHKTATEMSNKMLSARRRIQGQALQRLLIKGDSKNDSLEIRTDDLLFIQAVDNYCEAHYLKEGQLHSKLLRASLKNIESQFEDFPNILRCHRSFIVNKVKISRLSGNARAYYLHFEAAEEQVPLSRGFDKETLLH